MTAKEILALLKKSHRDAIRIIARALEDHDACLTGRVFRRKTGHSLVALGICEEKGAYQVDEHDNMTDRWRVGYRFTPLGAEVSALLAEADQREFDDSMEDPAHG